MKYMTLVSIYGWYSDIYQINYKLLLYSWEDPHRAVTTTDYDFYLSMVRLANKDWIESQFFESC